MSEWQNEDDFLEDINFISDFKDDDNSTEIEVNHSMFMDDDSNDKIKEEICDINKPSHSDRQMMDQVALEVTEGLRLAGCLREDEGAFFKLKMEQQKSSTTQNIAEQQYPFTKMEYQPTNFNTEQQSTAVSLDSLPKKPKPKRNKFRPLVEPSGFTSVSKNEWVPVRKDHPLDKNNFPKLK